ncbi:MAG: twin-arginine translocase subunit TatC [Anaerolineaceae bacterium]|nr:twin-arginine translocase subunit TatC [Anaerolineaceae bacterium]MDD4041923.1 twin-arginine translocase subunit TatC [Anaerolineaceae bacterium]MDD4577937.1 twin-arginine translocase subunit TatC [Anaerolineaceae bacterium]
MTDETEKLPLASHLEELRKALLLSVLGLLAGVVATVFFVNPILSFLTKPIGGLQNLHAIEVTETMSVYMRISLLGGLIIALPWIVFQLLRFISKGLKPNERKAIFLTLPFMVMLFLAGVAFAYYVMLPTSLTFFREILDVTTSIRLKSYVSFTTNLLFWIGTSFQLPLVFFILTKVGIVNPKLLVRGWRVAIVVIAVLAAVITPTGDPINMLIFMLPLFVLYLLSILLSALANKPAKTEE